MSILSLPLDMIERVAHCLKFKDALTMRKVCKMFRDAVDSSIVRRKPHIIVENIFFTRTIENDQTNDEIDFQLYLSNASISTKTFLRFALRKICGDAMEVTGRWIRVNKCSMEKLDEYLAKLAVQLGQITVNYLEMHWSTHDFAIMVSRVLEGAVIKRQTLDFVDPFTDERCELALNFISQFDSECIRIVSTHTPLPYDLLRRLADTTLWITVSTRKDYHSIDSHSLIEFVFDIFTRTCQVLDLSDTLMITEDEAKIIANNIREMQLKVNFTAAIKAKPVAYRFDPTNYRNNGDVIYQVHSQPDSEVSIVEIRDAEMRAIQRYD